MPPSPLRAATLSTPISAAAARFRNAEARYLRELAHAEALRDRITKRLSHLAEEVADAKAALLLAQRAARHTQAPSKQKPPLFVPLSFDDL